MGDLSLHCQYAVCGIFGGVDLPGLLFNAMRKDGVRSAIIVSSVTFGLGHIVNLLNGAELVMTLLQLVYAIAIGFLFTVIFWKGGSLLPCIISHGVLNAFGVFANPDVSVAYQVTVSAILVIISFLYAGFLLKRSALEN